MTNQIDRANIHIEHLIKTGEHDWPPIINLSEADGYFFETGNAILSKNFINALNTQVIPALLQVLNIYKANVIEVIGHTDEQRISQRLSNLDDILPLFFNEGLDISQLIPGDNAGLGLARAISVSQHLSSDIRISEHMKILPLSGAQLIQQGDILTDWSYSGSVQERRRIEIRVRRSDN